MYDVIIVTGMAGAGRTSCLKILEDLGFEAVDNLPIDLIDRILSSEIPLSHALAIGIDSRTRGFDPLRLINITQKSHALTDVRVRIVFFECDDEVLRRRFSETRRRHPLSPDRPVADGIRQERNLLAPLKDAAAFVFDTTELSVPGLRALVNGHFTREDSQALTLTVMSFAFKHGVPREADLVFDVRFLRNPHYVDELRERTGLEAPVRAYIDGDEGLDGFLQSASQLLLPLLPRYLHEGKTYLTIAIGCTGGKHRSVYVTERVADALASEGWLIRRVHRDIPIRSSNNQTMENAQ